MVGRRAPSERAAFRKTFLVLNSARASIFEAFARRARRTGCCFARRGRISLRENQAAPELCSATGAAQLAAASALTSEAL